MHTYFNPVLIYGWRECNYDSVIDETWLSDIYANIIHIYTLEVSKGYAANAVYGIKCKMNTDGTIVLPSDNDICIVKSAYDKFIDYQQQYNDGKSSYILGYYQALEGDICWDEHEMYILEDSESDDYWYNKEKIESESESESEYL